LSRSTSEGLVPQVWLAAERNICGAGPLGTPRGLIAVGAGVVVTAPAGLAAMPTIALPAAVGAPRLPAASPKAKTLPDADTCQ
jgi:hypothetical protein